MGYEGLDSSHSLSLLPVSIFILVTVFQLLDVFISHSKKKEFRNSDENKIQQEIRKLLGEANLLSTPSTFAQAAKLRRLAAAKEKELLKVQQENTKEKRSSGDLYARVLTIVKALTYVGLSFCFWGVPIAMVHLQLLQPFGKVLSWTAGNPATGLIKVGMVPWLVLTTRVSKVLSQKLCYLVLQRSEA